MCFFLLILLPFFSETKLTDLLTYDAISAYCYLWCFSHEHTKPFVYHTPAYLIHRVRYILGTYEIYNYIQCVVLYVCCFGYAMCVCVRKRGMTLFDKKEMISRQKTYTFYTFLVLFMHKKVKSRVIVFSQRRTKKYIYISRLINSWVFSTKSLHFTTVYILLRNYHYLFFPFQINRYILALSCHLRRRSFFPLLLRTPQSLTQ